MVRAEENLFRPDQLFQRPNNDGIARCRSVVVEPPQVVELRIWRRRFGKAFGRSFGAKKASGQSDDGPTAVRQHVTDIGRLVRRATLDQADDGAADIRVVLDGRFTPAWPPVSTAAARCGAMCEDSGIPAIQLLEHGSELWIPEPLLIPAG